MALTFSFRNCLGLNTQSAPNALTYDPQTGTYELAAAVNIDILDNGRRWHPRPGFSRVLGGNWRDGFNDAVGRAYAVCDDVLGEILSGPSFHALHNGLTPGLRVVWCQLKDMVFWSNSAEKGCIRNGEAEAWGGKEYPRETEAGRYAAPPAGQCLAAFAGRIWIAVGNILYYTAGPGEWHFVQLAHDRLTMPSRIRMLRPVDDGLYVGVEDRVLFLAGTDPGGMQWTLASPDPAIEGTDLSVRVDDVLPKANPGNGILWTGQRGICLGLPGGSIINLTKNRVALAAAASHGAAVLLPRRYVAVLHP